MDSDTVPETVEVTAPKPGRPRCRTAVYCAVLAALAGVLMFWELGADALTGDEAQYALVAQHIKMPGGSWINTTPYPPTPYFEKPPLYFWLTASTYNLLGGGEFAARAWSAAAGVGAIVLVCVFGAMLISPEVGGLAGLLLLMNRAFLLEHGARSGTFDAVVTFLSALAIVIYWLTSRGTLRWSDWIVIGITCGLASVTKPFIGVPLIALLALHAIFISRGSPLRARLLGIVLAIFVCATVTAPWYVAQWHAHPGDMKLLWQHSIVERITHGVDDKHVEKWWFYPQEVSKSAIPFLLVIPAAIYALARWIRGPNRSEISLLLLTGVGWVVLFSFSASKSLHYVYPAFPALAVILATGAFDLARRFPRRIQLATTLALGIAFSFQFARTLYHSIPADRSPYVPWEMHKSLAPAIKASRAQVVFYGFPEKQIEWRSQMQLRARDCYYLEQMRPGSAWARSPGDLASLLHDGKPTLLVLSRKLNLRELLANSNIPQRTDDRFAYEHQGYLLLGIDMKTLLEPSVKPGESNPYIIVDEQSPDRYRLALRPAVVGPARVSVRLKLPADAPAQQPVRCVFTLDVGSKDSKTLDDNLTVSRNGVLEVGAVIEQRYLAASSVHKVTVLLRPPPGSSRPVQTTFEDARLTMLPHIPPESHPRR